MLALAEYVAQGAELQTLGTQYDTAIKTYLNGKDREKLTPGEIKEFVKQYTDEYRAFIQASMTEVAETAIGHYEDQLGVKFDEHFPTDVVSDVFSERYYGATLDERLVVQARQLERRLAQANTLSMATQTFTNPSYGGSQTVADRRLLLGMLAKIENEAARQVAHRSDIKLIRWTTSHRHKQPDICDDLASAIDKRVVAYLNENNFKEDPKGLYFVDDLAEPPHPNCQCEYSMVIPNVKRTETLVKRAANKVRSILKRIRRK